MNLLKLLTFIICLTSGTFAFAQSHEEDICSEQVKVCVHYEADKTFTTKDEGRFELHLESLNNEANLVKIDLWMQMGNHGHGSSPLKVTPVSPGVYDITKAYFVMPGQWQIRVTYKFQNTTETLIIPVLIK